MRILLLIVAVAALYGLFVTRSTGLMIIYAVTLLVVAGALLLGLLSDRLGSGTKDYVPSAEELAIMKKVQAERAAKAVQNTQTSQT